MDRSWPFRRKILRENGALESRECAGDGINAKVMKDPRLAKMMDEGPIPFDVKCNAKRRVMARLGRAGCKRVYGGPITPTQPGICEDRFLCPMVLVEV